MSPDGGLRALLRRHLPRVHWQSVESHGTGRGTPDVEGCHDGVSFWVECKATSGWSVTLRPEQVAWHLRRARAGGRSFVAVRRAARGGPRNPAADELWLLRGSAARELRSGGLRWAGDDRGGALVGCWSQGPSAWDWEDVLRGLLGAL